jgi:autotransporter-associated beta strand protein
MNTLPRSKSSARILKHLSLSLICFVCALAGKAWADSAEWVGGGNPDGRWSNPLNWASGVVPGNPLAFASTNYNTPDGAVIFDFDTGFYDSLVTTNWTIGRLAFTNSGNVVLHGADLTLNQAQSSGVAGQASIDITGTPTVTISNNLIFPAASNTPATNIRHQLWALNASTMNFYGNLIKPNDGPGQLTFRGNGGGTFNVYGAVLWDTNLVSRTDVSTVGFYNSGNVWTQMNISVGTIVLGVDNALPINSLLNFNQNSGGASFLRMNNFNQTLLALASTTVGNGSNTQTVDTATSSILTLNDNSGNNTFGGAIIGGGKLLKIGNGTLTLITNNSSYTGGTLISGGTLSLGNGTTGGAITGYITNNATLIVNKTDNLTLPNAISGSGQLRKLGTGTLTLSDVNPYSGSTAVSNGTLLVSGALSGNGAMTVGGGTLRVDGQLSGSGAVSVFGTATLMGSGSIAGPVTAFTNGQIQTSVAPTPATLTFSNNLTLNSGAFASYKFGGPTNVGGGANDLFDVKGSLTLSNNPLVLVPVGLLTVGNTYVVANAGGTLTGSFGTITNPTRYTITTTTSGNQAKLTVSGGTNANLIWRGTNANWDLTTSNWLNGANSDKFFQGDSVTFDDSATIFSESLTTALYPKLVTVNTTNTYAFAGSGKLSGAASLTKTGAGSLVISNANDFTGSVIVNGGTLKVGSTTALGATNGGTIIADGATLELNGVSLFSPGELITISGAGLNNTGAVINSTADQNNAIRYLSLATNATVATWTNRWDVRGPGGNGSFSGGLFLNGYTLTKLGTNKMSLVDLVATTGGSVRVVSGTLGLTRSMVDGPGFIDGGSALVQIENSSFGYVNKPMLFNGGRLQVNGNTFTLGSAITNSGLTIDVTNGLTLTLTNLLTGPGSLTKVGLGTLELQQPDFGSGPTTVSAGTMLLDAGSGLPNTLAISVASAATLDVSSVAGGLVLTNGATLSGSGTIQGDVIAGSGTTVSPGSSPGTLTVAGNTTFSNATLNFELGANPAPSDPGNDFYITYGNLNLSGLTTINLIPIANLSFSSPYPLIQFGNLASGGAANLKLVTQSRYQFALLNPTTTAPFVQVQVTGGEGGANLIWQGDAAANPGVWDLKTTRNWLKGGAPDFFYTGDYAIFDDTAKTNVATLAGNLSPLAVTLSNNVLNFTFGGTGAIVSGSLTNWGSRSLRVANTSPNTLSGLDIENGSVTLANAAANSLPNGFTANNGTLTFANTGANTFDVPFSVNGGAVIFSNSAANDFGQGFNLNGGTLTLANGFANNLGGSPNINSTLFFLQPVDVAVPNTLFGGGIIRKQSTNMLTLSANNGGFSGTVQVESGVLRNGATSGLSSGNVVVKDGASLDVGGQNCTSASSTTIQGNGFNGTGSIRNTGADQQNGFRNVVLAANAQVAGPNRWDIRGATSGGFGAVLDLAGFKLQKQSPNKVSIVDATLPNDGTIEILGGILGITRDQVGGTQPIIIGTNMLQFENNSVTNALVSKPLTIAGGYIQVVGNSFGIGSTVNNLSGANVDIANGLTFFISNTISGPGLLIKTNTGTLVINAANSFTGNVLVQGGVLQAGNNQAIPANNSVTLSNTTALTGGPGATLDLLTNVISLASVPLTAYTTFSPDIRTSIRGAGPGTQWNGPITLNGDGRFGIYADSVGSALIVNGSINGPSTGTNTVVFVRGNSGFGTLNGRANFIGQLFKTDAGTWLINSTSNVWSTMGVAVGTLRLGTNNALCPTAPLTMGQADGSSPVLDLNGFNQTVNGLAFIASTTTGTRRIGNDSTNSDSVFTYAGTNVSTYAGQFVDNVTTNGNHKLSLVVASGTLYLNGVNSNTGPTVVQSGATLGGIGALLSSVTVQAGGTLSPGSGAIGRLGITNSLTFAAGATHFAEVNAATGTNDLVGGLTSVTYGGTLVISNVSAALLTNGATFKLFDAAARSGSFASLVSLTPGQTVTWDTSRLIVDGTITVAQATSSQQPTLATAVNAGVLTIAWPTNYLGWRLLGETNAIGVGLTTNWFYVPGSASTNAVYMNIDQTKGSVFFRLVYP